MSQEPHPIIFFIGELLHKHTCRETAGKQRQIKSRNHVLLSSRHLRPKSVSFDNQLVIIHVVFIFHSRLCKYDSYVHVDISEKDTYIPGRSHITKIPPYFFDHSEVAPKLSFRLISRKLPRNIDVGGPGRFRSGDINASKNKNLQLSHAIMRVDTARRASFHSIRPRTNNSKAAIGISYEEDCVTMFESQL